MHTVDIVFDRLLVGITKKKIKKTPHPSINQTNLVKNDNVHLDTHDLLLAVADFVRECEICFAGRREWAGRHGYLIPRVHREDPSPATRQIEGARAVFCLQLFVSESLYLDRPPSSSSFFTSLPPTPQTQSTFVLTTNPMV